MMAAGKITKQQKKNIERKIDDVKAYRFNGLPVGVAIKAYKAGSEQEKAYYAPMLHKKIKSLKRTNKPKYNQMERQIDAVEYDMDKYL